ncbi:MAG TPA: DUF3857 domain-containing protein [Flavobacterium sp.]|jgi:hypothetical protein
MKNLLVITVTVLLSSFTFGQKFELGKVTLQELEEKTHPKDSAAAAAFLFKKGEVRFEYIENEGFIMYTEVKVRIKIYKKEGYDWANQKISYYLENNNTKENVTFSDAVTYNIVDGKIDKSKLKREGEFDEKINKYWGRKTITMPNVKEGSVIEYKYVIKSPRFSSLKEWYFQATIPVNFSEFTTVIPEYFIYNPNQKGHVFPKVFSEKISKSISITSKERDGFYTVKTTFTENKIDYTATKTIYTIKDVPALKDEPYINNLDNYTSSISHELSIIKFPNAPMETYSTDWQTVVKRIYENEDFGAELNRTGYFEDDLKTILKGLDKQEEKVAAIFNFIKSKVKWNGYYGYSCDEGVKSAYKNSSGNVAEINLMLTSMLRYAGINANPVLISTRSNGIALFPNRTAYNYVITAIETKDDVTLLDASEKFSTSNILPLRDLNWFGRLIRKDGTSVEIDLLPKSISKEGISMNVVLSADGSVQGKIRKQITDHLALSYRENKLGLKNELYLEQLENQNNQIQISDFTRENDFKLSEPIIETYTFKDDKTTEVIGNKLYFNPLLFLASTKNPFKQEKREYPLDFGFPVYSRYNINIQIPEGYVLESLPKAISLTTVDELASFKFNIVNNGNMIQVSTVTNINAAIVPSDYYDTIKDFFQKMIEKQNEKIVLKRI